MARDAVLTAGSQQVHLTAGTKVQVLSQHGDKAVISFTESDGSPVIIEIASALLTTIPTPTTTASTASSTPPVQGATPAPAEPPPTPAAPPPVFHPGEIWQDTNGVPINAHGGGMLFYNGTYYWFGEHKLDGPSGDVAQVGVHVYSSKDLGAWKDEGIALSVSDDPQSEITKGCILERPKVLFNKSTRKFVMWFHLELKGQGYAAARAGVAVSDSVTGPYEYVNSFRINPGVSPQNGVEGGSVNIFKRDFDGGQMYRDATLFQDDDGSAYAIYSSEENQTLQIAKLSDDYLSPSGEFVRILPGQSNEAPAMFKHNGRYFLITSGTNGWKPCDARLATADSIFGDWQARGNPCQGTDWQKRTTFESQSNYVLPVAGKKDAFIFMADRWRSGNPWDKPGIPIDRRYVWLPIQWDSNGLPFLAWKDSWGLDFFDSSDFRAGL
jgi:hypothetical protein